LTYVDKYDKWWCDRCQQYDPEATPTKPKRDKNKCSACGSGLVYVDKYDRWWCDRCRKYDRDATPIKPKGDKNKCSACGYGLEYVDKYDRWWCDRCRQYDAKGHRKDKKKRGPKSGGLEDDTLDFGEIDAAISDMEEYEVDFSGF